MSKLTITEALAEIKTIGKRIVKKQTSVMPHLYRPEALRDPFASNGGTPAHIQSEMQSVSDLLARLVDLRIAIAVANASEELTVEGVTKTIAEWLIYRREVLPLEKRIYHSMQNELNAMRKDAQKKGVNVVAEDKAGYEDVIVNVNEKELSDTIERLEVIEGTLDGLLSLKNATVTFAV
jgi:hypothetical protein